MRSSVQNQSCRTAIEKHGRWEMNPKVMAASAAQVSPCPSIKSWQRNISWTKLCSPPSWLRATWNMDVCMCQDVFLFSDEESRLWVKYGLDNTYWKSFSFSKNILALAVVSKSIPSKPVSTHRAMTQSLLASYKSQCLHGEMKPFPRFLGFSLFLVWL